MSDRENIIETSNLTKTYGKRRGIKDVNLSVKQGEIFGYLGPNGAGKTTTIRTLLDFIRPTQGSASIFGLDVKNDSVAIHRRIGYLPGELSLYENMTGEELLKYVGKLRKSNNWDYVRTLAKRFDCDLSRRIKALSHGNKQKIGLLQAFIHKPELLILDEPTNGLDPLMQHEFYQMLLEIREQGNTIFLSSHILPEVEKICDRIGIIRQGSLITVETIETLKAHALRQIEIHFAAAVPADKFTDISGVRNVRVNDNMLICTVIGSLDALIKVAAQYEIVNIISHEPSLEEIFMTYYDEGKNNAE